MRCFRLAHSGVVLEHEGSALVIDPGNFSEAEEIDSMLHAAQPITGIVITHEHADHWTPEVIQIIRATAANAPIFTTEATSTALANAGITDSVHVVAEGDRHEAGGFTLDFYGRRHEQLHSSVPLVDNVGVRVNGAFAWGGDSLVRPPFRIDTLGIPVGSPWSNIAQVMDFVLDAMPKRAYLTHDGMLSANGLGMFRSRVEWCLAQTGGELITLPRLDGDPGARFDLGEVSIDDPPRI